MLPPGPLIRRHAASLVLLALGIALIATQLGPPLDIAWMRLWFDAGERRFIGQSCPAIVGLYRAVPWLGWILLALAIVVVTLPSTRRRPHWRRAAASALGIAVIANGVIVEAGFKDQWGRPRPTSVQPFGGPHAYTPVWQPAAACARNCSLASGHAAAGFWLMAWGALAQRRRWHRLMIAGIVLGLSIGVGRTMQGAHFPSDVLAAGCIVLACSLIWRRLWIRARWWRRHSLMAAQGRQEAGGTLSDGGLPPSPASTDRAS